MSITKISRVKLETSAQGKCDKATMIIIFFQFTHPSNKKALSLKRNATILFFHYAPAMKFGLEFSHQMVYFPCCKNLGFQHYNKHHKLHIIIST